MNLKNILAESTSISENKRSILNNKKVINGDLESKIKKKKYNLTNYILYTLCYKEQVINAPLYLKKTESFCLVFGETKVIR